MHRTRLLRAFWPAFLVSLTVLLLVFHLLWKPVGQKLPARCKFPFPEQGFLWNYEKSGTPAQAVYYFGMFGTGRAIEESDVLLAGSSHMTYGISAELLSKALSEKQGRPVRVFNMGLPSEQLGFISVLLKRHHAFQTPLIVDMYSRLDRGTPGRSDYARQVLGYSRFSAWLQVGKVYADFARDWLLDPWLPCYQIGLASDPVRPERYLGDITLCRPGTGDLLMRWTSSEGDVFLKGNTVIPTTSDLKNAGIITRTTVKEFLSSHPSPTVFILIPYAGSNTGTLPDTAQPFVPISREELTLSGGTQHLSASGRAKATERLLQGLEALDFPPPLPSSIGTR
jgi:hypothetical protein